jgi:hypothetical protein
MMNYSRLGGLCWTALHIVDLDQLILIPGSDSQQASVGLRYVSSHQFDLALRRPSFDPWLWVRDALAGKP